MYDVLIIGGGPGGIYASIISALNKLDSCIVEALPSIGGQPNFLYPLKDIYDFPGFSSITGGNVISMLINQMNSLSSNKPDIFLNNFVSKIERDSNFFIISLSNGKIIKSKSIIIATGTMSLQSKKVCVDDEEINQDNIKYVFESNEDYQNSEVVILGGGDSALDWTIHLNEKKIPKKISIVHRTNELRARKDKIEKIFSSDIEIYLDFSISKITNNEITIINNETGIIKNIYFDKILVQYGVKPTMNKFVDLLENISTQNNKIVVDKNFQSSIDMVYAIGKVNSFDPTKPDLIIVSISEAAKAVYSISSKLKEKLINGRC